VPTTTKRPATDVAAFIGGFVAAEGCFHARSREGWFGFAVALGAEDVEMVELLHAFLGCGRTTWRKRRKEHYDDEVSFVVRKMRDLVETVIPFMDEHLPPSYKREQYEVWRAQVLAYWDTGMKRRRPCTVEGCEVLQRAKGLCRGHYYARYGK
jgi:hypothetical protein